MQAHPRAGARLELPASIGKIGALYGKPFRPAELYSLPPGASDDETRREASRWEGRVRYEEIAERHLGCLAVPGYDVERIEQVWRELIERASQLGLVRDDVDAWGAGSPIYRLLLGLARMFPAFMEKRVGSSARGPQLPGPGAPVRDAGSSAS